MRKLIPPAAFFAGLLGFGYVYVGQISVALTLIVCGATLLALISWTRLILEPWGFYLLVAVGVGLFLLQVIHPTRIAIRRPEAPQKPYNRWWVYVCWTVMAGVCAEVLSTHRPSLLGYETFWIPYDSMAPTLNPGDRVMVDTWRYDDRKPVFGELVVFDGPPMSGMKSIKRMVGLPGDQIEIRDGVLIRNGHTVAEPYLHARFDSPQIERNLPPVKLASQEYYLLGDNRDNSRDSRLFGPVNSDHIRGRVEYIWFSSFEFDVDLDRFPRRLVSRDN